MSSAREQVNDRYSSKHETIGRDLRSAARGGSDKLYVSVGVEALAMTASPHRQSFEFVWKMCSFVDELVANQMRSKVRGPKHGSQPDIPCHVVRHSHHRDARERTYVGPRGVGHDPLSPNDVKMMWPIVCLGHVTDDVPVTHGQLHEPLDHIIRQG